MANSLSEFSMGISAAQRVWPPRPAVFDTRKGVLRTLQEAVDNATRDYGRKPQLLLAIQERRECGRPQRQQASQPATDPYRPAGQPVP